MTSPPCLIIPSFSRWPPSLKPSGLRAPPPSNIQHSTGHEEEEEEEEDTAEEATPEGLRGGVFHSLGQLVLVAGHHLLLAVEGLHRPHSQDSFLGHRAGISDVAQLFRRRLGYFLNLVVFQKSSAYPVHEIHTAACERGHGGHEQGDAPLEEQGDAEGGHEHDESSDEEAELVPDAVPDPLDVAGTGRVPSCVLCEDYPLPCPNRIIPPPIPDTLSPYENF